MEKKKKREGFFSKNIIGDINDVPDTLVDLGEKNDEDKKRIEELEKQLKIAREEKAALEIVQDTKDSEMKNTLDALKKQNREMALRVETLEMEKQTLRKAADHSNQPSAEHLETVDALKRENKQLMVRLGKLEIDNDELEADVLQLEPEVLELKKKLEQVESERQAMIEATERLKEENQKVIALNEEIRQENETAKHEMQAEKEAIAELKRQVEALYNENEDLKLRNDQLEEERTDEEVEIIHSENNQLKQENNRLKVRIKGLEESTSSKLELHEQEMALKQEREALEAEIFKSQQEIGEVLLNAQKQGSRTIERAKFDADEILKSANEELQTIKMQVKDIALEVEESKQSVVGIYSELQTRIRKMADGVNEVN
ncbi:hypothetical protein [Candidatus Enterococcus murrayae]|uniref:Uncharacterized protein n=1 Tax=Candidatus Enterococcus murrayae TaxID=2815321 RepID=A0ABS3HF31_9ENTE|nr:hypothetical protein [Enterococcus sp. MJM16]MBO0451173.1 hypothetical protein [Enterococcus sp. MJM16]